MKPGKAIKLIAFGRTLGLDLAGDPRPVRVEIRHGEHRYCIEFGGARGRYIPARKLVAKDAARADEAWITDMYTSALAEASDSERTLAHKYLQDWLKNRRE